ADTTTAAPYNEFRNTMDAIENTFGEQFRYDNLTSFSQLTAALPSYDILLLLEQENMNQTDLTAVTNAWTSPLTAFVNGGGIVIALDCNGAPGTDLGAGPTMQILNETGLMEVHTPYDGVGWPLNLVNATDALARGVAASWSAPDGSVRFVTPDATVVVDDGASAIVAHKIIGAGHVVLLGFDLWTTEPNSEILLANAIRLHRHVVFDYSHDNLGSVVNGYSLFAEDLANNGFAVSGMNNFDADYLQAAEVLIIPAADYHGLAEYTTSDLDVIEAFVSSGGGLFILSDLGVWGNVTDPVNERFGFVRNKTSILYDSDDFNGASSGYAVIYSGSENIINHSATLKVNSLETWSGTGLESMPATAVPLIVTDSDGTSTYDSWISTNGTVFAAAVTHGQGRVVFIGDANLFNDNDYDTDGTEAYFDTDSELLGVNTIRWLSAAGIEEKVVLFDASHGYNFHVTASYYGFANLLTENGFTVYWMSTFYESLMDKCDVFVIEDGSTNYTLSELDTIESFVEDGGSIFLIGGNDANGEQADYVGNRFGLDLNNTGYLFDSDDYILLSGYIAYNASNFDSHPIMNGIEVFESYIATGFDSIGSADALITTDTDDTCTWSNGGVANGLPILVAKEHNKGRLVFSGDYRFPRYNGDDDSDGTSNLYDADNPLLLLNIFHWLAEGRAPTVEVIFPNGGEVLNGTELVTWDANDFDDDSLTFDVLYSNNSGSDWNSLATGLTVLEYEWNTTLHDDGSEYLIRVIVSDGEFSVTDDSDSAFSIDNVADTTTGTGFGDWDITTIIIIIVAGGVVIIIIIIIKRKK
ncbi:MAG: hypothetical protein ACTSYJ_02440, partial [Candidatus Thorarchaeota archaeon]